jgi:phospholipid/cholesterol/gamma-HCH transport system substrate-binding protein
MKITREFKIGLVAFVAVALAIWGINYLKGINIFKTSDHYYAVYPNVQGLVGDAAVYLNGYRVGSVSKIEIDEKNVNKIIVEVSLEKRLNLQKNTTLLLKNGSLISGAKDVHIIMGTGPGSYEPGDTIPSAVQVEITDFVEPLKVKIESMVNAIDTVMISLNKLMNDETRKNLQGTVANLNSATSSLKASLQPSGSLSNSLNNLDAITANLKKSNADITAIFKNFEAVSDTLKQSDLKMLINHARETFAQTTEMLTAINNGKGTAGQLIMNDSAYVNLNNSLANLDSLLIDLREHPKRYVHFSVFGKKDK